jgi:hypothetical protein
MGTVAVLRAAVTGEKLKLHPVDAKWRVQEKVAYEWTDFPWLADRHFPPINEQAQALVVGTGPTAGADLSLIDPLSFEVFCVNEAIFYRELKPDHLVTWHSENLEGWIERFYRERGDCSGKPLVHSWRDEPAVDIVWKWGNAHGSSALHAVGVALSMGYQTVIVAGVPLSGRCEGYRVGWLGHRWMLDRVLGISGWIADEFGKYEEA